MKKFRRLLKKLVHNPFVDFAVGIILLLSGLWETIDTFPADFADFRLAGHHGLVVFGFITALKAMTDVFAGLEFMDEAEYVEKEENKKK